MNGKSETPVETGENMPTHLDLVKAFTPSGLRRRIAPAFNLLDEISENKVVKRLEDVPVRFAE